MSIFIFSILLVILLVTFLVLLSVSLERCSDEDELGSFECGYDSFVCSRLPYCLRFFSVIVIFLLFDMEIILLVPFIHPKYSYSGGELSGFLVVVFLIIIGFLYEWFQGGLDWV